MALVTQTEIRTATINDVNFDVSLILDSFIETSQFTHIMPLLGNKFYTNVINNVGNYTDLLNGTTYTYSEETYMFRGIKDLLCWYSIFDNVDFLHSKINNKGVMSESNEFSQQVQQETINKLKAKYFKICQLIADEITIYLNRNTELYSLYLPSKNVHNTTKVYGGVIFKNNYKTTIENEEY